MSEPLQYLRHRRHQVPHRLQHRGGSSPARQAIKEALDKYYAEKGPSYEEVMEGFDENENRRRPRTRAGVADINDLEKSAAGRAGGEARQT